MKAKLLLVVELCFFILQTKAIQAPVASAPSGAAVQYGFSTYVQIYSVLQAKGYQYDFDTVSSFNSSYHYRDTSSSINYLTPQFRKGVKIYWRARAFIPGDTSTWSQTLTFTVASKAIAANPLNNTTGTIVGVGIYYATPDYTDTSVKYLFKLDTSATFTSPLAVLKTSLSSFYLDSALFTFGRSIYWQATAVSKWGDTLAWSDVFKYTIFSKPDKPTVLSSNYPRAVLSWTLASMSVTELQVDTTPTFNSPYMSIRSNPRITVRDTLYDLYFGKRYYFRIRQVFDTTHSNWSDSTTLVIFGGGALTSPASNSTVQSLNPVINWRTVFGAQQRVQIFTDSNYTQLLFDTFTTSSTSGIYYPGYLTLNSWYYARVRYMHAKDTTVWFNTKFKTYTGQVVAYTPVGNASNLSPRVTFKYIAMPWATSYQLEVDSGSAFTSNKSRFYLFCNINAQEGYYNSFDTLVGYGGKYVWRVRAIQHQDTGEFSAPQVFYTASAPTLYFPSNGFIGIGTNTGALVNEMDGTSWVQWQLDSSASFASPELHSGMDAHIPDDFQPQYVYLDFPSDLLFKTTYYWRARMISRIDTGQWSASFNFSTTTDMRLLTPANNSTNVSVRPYLSWNIQGDVADYGYQYQLSTNSSFTTPTTVTLANVDEAGDSARCGFSTKYYWRARAFHSRDTSGWSAPFVFTTTVKPSLPSPMLILPSPNEVDVPVNPVYLSWNYNNSQVTFDVQVASDNLFTQLKYQANTANQYHEVYGIKAYNTYYWRVRAKLDTLLGPWSEIRLFTTIPPVGLKPIDLNKLTQVYPNPAANKVYVEIQQASSVCIYDVVGAKVGEDINENRSHEFDTSTWKQGIYFMYINTKDGTIVKKIEVAHP